MRNILLAVLPIAALAFAAGAAPACGSSSSSSGPAGDGGGDDGSSGCVGFCNPDGGKPGCVGLECNQVDCPNPMVSTTLTGTVLDPAGKVPIFNAVVYVPRDNPPMLPAITDGATCDRCDAKIMNAVAITSTDTAGNFVLPNVPVVDNLPLVVQIGKWRRLVTLQNTVQKCAIAPVDPAVTRLPKNQMEGNIPHMAVTTGAADALQCLLRKIGIDDAEFGIAGSAARVHLYQGGGFTSGTPQIASGKIAGGAQFPKADTLWNDAATLGAYDLVILGCEGAENDGASYPGATKPDASKTAMYAYAKAGGRIFMSHYHEVWIRTNPDAAVSGVGSFVTPIDSVPPPAVPMNPKTTAVSADISTAFAKGQAMSDWLSKQGALSGGKLPIFDARDDVNTVTTAGLSWITAPNPNQTPAGKLAVEYMSFTAPVGAPDANVCGRVVLSDIHVSGAANPDDATADFPTGCNADPLNAQQKALEFMLFDLSSCIETSQGTVDVPH
jgi:hypothetical protein